MNYSDIAATPQIIYKAALMRVTIQPYSRRHWRALILGAINGLLVGGVVYAALWLSVENENQRLFYQQLRGGDAIHVTVGIKWYGLPIVGTIAFALGGFLVHTYLAHRVKSILVLWQIVGAVSILCAMLFVFSIVLVDHFFGSVPIDYGNALSLRLLWIVLAACGFVALINLLYGGFIQISARQYAQHMNQMN